MLAVQFFLFLESLIRREAYANGSERVLSTSTHVPVRSGDELTGAAMPARPFSRRHVT